MEKPDSIKQKEAYIESRKQVLELIKQLSDESDDKFIKDALKEIAKDIVEAPNLRLKLLISHKELEEDWEAMI